MAMTTQGSSPYLTLIKPGSLRKEANNMRIRTMAATALVLVGEGVAFSLTACGGPNSTTSEVAATATNQQFITKLNSICDKDNQQQSAIGAPPNFRGSPTMQDLPSAAAYLDKMLLNGQFLVTNLSQLGEPPQNQHAFDVALDALRKAGDDVQAADQAAKAGDLNSFKTQLASYKDESNQADNLIHSFGTTHCGPGRGSSSAPAAPSAGISPPTTS